MIPKKINKPNKPKETKNYLGNTNLKASDVPIEFTKHQLEEYARCQRDPVYFIRNYVKIISLDRGLVPFDLYDFQEEIVQSIHNNRFVIAKLPRQTGKSTTITAYLLHYILFNQSVNVAILANKMTTARELLGRLKLAYEYLPKWLQQGIVEWNKGSIQLENGSRVLASATSSSAIRGGSFSAILLDEFAYVPQEIAEEFFSSVYPTISSGTETKLMIVSTPHGMNLFYKLWTDAINRRNSYIPFEVHWSDVPGRDEKWRLETIANTSEEQFNTEHGCEFLGSIQTLISPAKLKTLAYIDPIIKNGDGFKVYEKPEPNHVYVMCVDTSRGTGNDYSAFTVLDITNAPYKMVAMFKNNLISPMVFPTAIYVAAKQYNNAYVMVELNDMGEAVANSLHSELEYANMIFVSHKGRKGQTVDGGFGSGGSQLGVRTSEPVKRIGCSTLKSLIESDKLIIQDFDTIRELFSFVVRKNSFEAETGYNDDLVMTLVLFSWLCTQPYFKELTNMNIKDEMFSETIKQLEDDMTPFGFQDDGDDVSVPERESDGSLWYKDAKEKYEDWQSNRNQWS
jgi:hypothetical protein